MKKKYVFSTAGVAQWQACLAAASAGVRNEEATRVDQGLYVFLPERFLLDAEQLAYLHHLPPALCHLWATQIAYAIRNNIPVELAKPEDTGGLHVMNTKYIVSEGSNGTQPTEGYTLRFNIAY